MDTRISTTHELVPSLEGSDRSFTLRHMASGETMHSKIGPWEEANSLYVSQSRLPERAKQGRNPLVIYDIGLGVAANSIAVLEAYRKLENPRPLHLVSFESDLSGLRLALSSVPEFPFLSGYEETLNQLLEDRILEKPGLKWELKASDFRSLSLQGPAPELIFFDFYSPKTNPELWTREIFEKLYSACKARLEQGLDSTLITYSASTLARASMILAGFHVGHGVSTSAKRETTLASTRAGSIERPLQQPWLRKLAGLSGALTPEEIQKITSCVALVP